MAFSHFIIIIIIRGGEANARMPFLSPLIPHDHLPPSPPQGTESIEAAIKGQPLGTK